MPLIATVVGYLGGASLTRPPEEQQAAIGIFDFKSPQIVTVVHEWLKQIDIARREFRRHCLRIRDKEIGVPAGNALLDISRVVRHWIDTDVLHHDHCRALLDDAEENVVATGSLERDVEPESVAIER